MPTHQINSNAAETSASGEKSCFSKTVYLRVYKGERMAFADYTSRGARWRPPQRPIYARVMLPSSSWRATDDLVWPCVEFGFLPGAHRIGPEGIAGHDRAIGFARRRAAARVVLADQQSRLRACAGLGRRRGPHSIGGHHRVSA